MSTNQRQTAGPSRRGSREFRIKVEHDMQGASVPDLEKRFIDEKNRITTSPVVLDLIAVRQIESRGIALCIGLYQECLKRTIPFHIETGPELYKLFQILKLTRVLDIREVSSV